MVKLFMIGLLMPIMAFGKMTIPTNLGDLCTPSNPDFKEFRYKERIPVCNRNVSSATKKFVCNRDGVKDRTNYLVNHYFSLFAGGSNSPTNLYCQPLSRNTANIEYDLFQKLKSDSLTIEEVRDTLIKVNNKLINELNNE